MENLGKAKEYISFVMRTVHKMLTTAEAKEAHTISVQNACSRADFVCIYDVMLSPERLACPS